MTPGELFDRLEVFSEVTKQQQEVNLTQAWATARLMRQKDFPTLKKLLHGDHGYKKLSGPELEKAKREHDALVEAAERTRRERRRRRTR